MSTTILNSINLLLQQIYDLQIRIQAAQAEVPKWQQSVDMIQAQLRELETIIQKCDVRIQEYQVKIQKHQTKIQQYQQDFRLIPANVQNPQKTLKELHAQLEVVQDELQKVQRIQQEHKIKVQKAQLNIEYAQTLIQQFQIRNYKRQPPKKVLVELEQMYNLLTKHQKIIDAKQSINSKLSNLQVIVVLICSLPLLWQLYFWICSLTGKLNSIQNIKLSFLYLVVHTVANANPKGWEDYQHWLRDILDDYQRLTNKGRSRLIVNLITFWRLLHWGWAMTPKSVNRVVSQKNDMP